MGLKCYKNADFLIFVINWVIAESKEDAWNIWFETYGEKKEDYIEDYMNPSYWEELPLSTTLNIEISNDFGLDSGKYTKTIEEWIKIYGRGLLCSTEY